MSTWGAQLFMPGGTFDVINAFLPAYMMDYFNATTAGNKSYSVPPGKTLQAKYFFTGFSIPATLPTLTISGGSLSWSNAGGSTIIVWIV